MTFLQRGAGAGEIATGLLQFDQQPADLHAHLQTVATPLNALGDADVVPGAAALAKFNATRRRRCAPHPRDRGPAAS